MTDITDQESRDMLEWARIAVANKDNQEQEPWVTAARYILDNVDAPEPTLAEELRSWAEDASYDEDRDNLLHAADRAEQMGHDLAEARAEVERLTAVNEELRRTDNYREFREKFLTVQKGAESNAETPDPADVPPGEALLVECRGERRAAVKDNDYSVPWCTVNADGWFNAEKNEDVTLVSRLVPAPRVITNPDELDALAEGAIVRDFADGEALQKIDGMWIAARRVRSAGYHSGRITPVTVLWEPGA